MNDGNNIRERMMRVSHFQGLNLEDIGKIICSGEFKRLSEGEYLFIEDLDCFGICVLLKGEINLVCLGPEGQENIVATIEPVIMFNEVAALDGGTNPATAVAVKDSLVWHADYESFQIGLQAYPQLGLGLLPVMAKRNRQILKKYTDLSFLKVQDRLIRLLLEKSNGGKTIVSRKENTIQQMASQIATSPVVISRMLGELKTLELIDVTRTKITITDSEEMAKRTCFEIG